ncbi:ABC-2 transporter permease [Clostridium sp.]|uniref:ABC-2 transporter permease n=1 Tax=Clostridium sp. TaxID=1506 RepID=UPI003217863F
MIALLKKDFITSRYAYSIITLLVGVILAFTSIKSMEAAMFIYVMGSMMIPIMVNKFTATEEMRKNYDIIINSFPVKRRDVVISKYIYYLVIYIATAVVLLGIITLVGRLNVEELKLILLVQSIVFIYYSLIQGVSNYIYYRFEYSTAAKYSSIIIISIIYVPFILVGFISKISPNIKEKFLSYGDKVMNNVPLVATTIILIGLAIYAVFILLSIEGYKKRDLQ